MATYKEINIELNKAEARLVKAEAEFEKKGEKLNELEAMLLGEMSEAGRARVEGWRD
ncbi:2327_t:CDS:1, partial [Funneliformis geosporum]